MPVRTGAVVILLTLAYTVARLGGQAPAYDLLIRNGRVVDGTGSPWFAADVAVRADIIAAVGPQLMEPRCERLMLAMPSCHPGSSTCTFMLWRRRSTTSPDANR